MLLTACLIINSILVGSIPREPLLTIQNDHFIVLEDTIITGSEGIRFKLSIVQHALYETLAHDKIRDNSIFLLVENLESAARESIYDLGNLSFPKIEKVEISNFEFTTAISYGLDVTRKCLSFRATINWTHAQ